MAIDQSLPKDAAGAAEFLAKLAIKDQEGKLCRYLMCEKPPRITSKSGRAPAYCDNPLHTPQRNLRARAYLEALASGLPAVTLETEQSANAVTVQSLRDMALARLEQFQDHLSLYVASLKELADPDIAASQIEAAEHRADARVAEAQEMVNTERSLRLAAENARTAAQNEAQAEREAAVLAIAKMQEAEDKVQRQSEEHERQIAQIQQERDQAIESIRSEMERRIEEIQQQAAQEIARAQDAAVAAQEEAMIANGRAREAETDARARIASAEQRVIEAQAALRREQDEIERLRQTSDNAAAEARKRSEADQAEIRRLRDEHAATIAEARARAEEDRTEVQHLRASLLTTTKRADDLALLNDTLRHQLVQIQMAERGKPDQKQ